MVLVFSEHKESVVADEFYGKDWISALENWFEEEFLLF